MSAIPVAIITLSISSVISLFRHARKFGATSLFRSYQATERRAQRNAYLTGQSSSAYDGFQKMSDTNSDQPPPSNIELSHLGADPAALGTSGVAHSSWEKGSHATPTASEIHMRKDIIVQEMV